MAITRANPLDALRQFQQALESFRSSPWLGSSLSAGGGYPPLNVFRKGDDLVVIAEVPGIAKADIQVQVKGRTIRLSGRKSFDYGEAAALHRRERSTGRFDRAITVPVEIDADGIKAECRDGILALHLPRAERDKPKTIAIG